LSPTLLNKQLGQVLVGMFPGESEINHERKRTTMRKLIESTLVSLDGVIEAPERWASFDAEATALSPEQLGTYDAFVMGRVTYENSTRTGATPLATPTSTSSTPCPSTSHPGH
jgi:hypothetical protein